MKQAVSAAGVETCERESERPRKLACDVSSQPSEKIFADVRPSSGNAKASRLLLRDTKKG